MIETEDISTDRQLRNILHNTGMPLSKFLKDRTLTSKFRRAGLYLFSVQVDEFNTFIKLGLSKNIVARLLGHRTSLFPVFDKMFVHCLVLKRSNLVPKPDILVRTTKDIKTNKDNRIDGKKVSFMFRAEKRIKDYLIDKNVNHLGEWFEMDIPKMIRLMLDHHFGLDDLSGDGYNCSFSIFTDNTVYNYTREYLNKLQANDIRRGRSNGNKWLDPSEQDEPQDKKLIKGIDAGADSEEDEDERD